MLIGTRGGGAEARHGRGGLKLMRWLFPRPLCTSWGGRACVLLGAVGGRHGACTQTTNIRDEDCAKNRREDF